MSARTIEQLLEEAETLRGVGLAQRAAAIRERHESFSLLDGVVKSFFATNKRYGSSSAYTLDDITRLALSTPRPIYFRYEYMSFPFLATVITLDDWEAALPAVVIKLNNDGFLYTRKKGVSVPLRHNSKTWISLPVEHFKPFCPELVNIIPESYEDVIIWYNYELERLDVRFLSKDVNRPSIEINFEHGSPYREDERQYRQRWR